jgi:2-methylcitrate dehydratase PrpD
MPDNVEVTRHLAQFVAWTEWDALTPPVVHQAKRALINFFAVALTGCREPAIETALQSLTAFSGGRRATIIGRGERLDALSAAFLNAASANVLDFCDTHVPTVIHPTAPVAPSLFALGELRDVSGRDLILAFVLGAEIECRIGLAMSPGGAGTSPRPAAYSAPLPGAEKFSGLRPSQWSLPSASPRPRPQACANASARRPNSCRQCGA